MLESLYEDISRETIEILADFIYIYICYMTSIKVYMHVLFSLVFPFILGVCFQMKVTFTLYLMRERERETVLYMYRFIERVMVKS